SRSTRQRGLREFWYGGLTKALKPSSARLLRQHLPRVHDPFGIQGILDLPHQRHGFPMLRLQEGDLAVADSVLTGASTAHGNGAHDHAVVVRTGAAVLLLVLLVDQIDEVEVAVAHMADQRGKQPTVLN